MHMHWAPFSCTLRWWLELHSYALLDALQHNASAPVAKVPSTSEVSSSMLRRTATAQKPMPTCQCNGSAARVGITASAGGSLQCIPHSRGRVPGAGGQC